MRELRENKEKQELYWKSTRYLNARHPVPQAYALPKIKFIEKYIFLEKKSILDIGCGNGIFTSLFSQKPIKNIFGLDSSLFMLRNNPCNNLVRGSAAILPYVDNSVDIVFEANLLHHVERPEEVIQEMERVSKEYLIFIEPNRLNPVMLAFFLLVKMERGGLKSSKRRLVNLIDRDGIKVVGAASMGMISQNNTPEVLLPLLRMFDREFVFGEYIVIVARKKRVEHGQ